MEHQILRYFTEQVVNNYQSLWICDLISFVLVLSLTVSATVKYLKRPRII